MSAPTPITTVEIVASLMRRSRSGSVTKATARAACFLFLTDLLLDYQVVEVSEALINQAILLAQRYKLHGCDAVQFVAGCQINAQRRNLDLDPVIFVSADQ